MWQGAQAEYQMPNPSGGLFRNGDGSIKTPPSVFPRRADARLIALKATSTLQENHLARSAGWRGRQPNS